jgi:hypothetical protein
MDGDWRAMFAAYVVDLSANCLMLVVEANPRECEFVFRD